MTDMRLIIADYNKQDTSAEADSIAARYGFKNKLSNDSEFGHLYRGKFGGLKAILKLEHISSGSNEAAKARIVQQVRETAGELAVYLPAIWLITQTPDKQFSVIVMEELQPLPEALRHKLFHTVEMQAKANPMAPLAVFSNMVVLRKIASRYFSDPSAIESISRAIASAAEGMKEFSAVALAERANKKLQIYADASALRESRQSFGEEVNGKFKVDPMYVNDVIRQILILSLVPEQKGALSIEPEPGSDVDKAIQALHLLSASGLHWDDLHDENILYRKSTNTPVFIDFGGYNLTK